VQGEKLFDLVVRMKPEYAKALSKSATCWWNADGQQIPLNALADIRESGGASFIYRENNSRYIGVQYSVEGPRPAERSERRQAAIADVQKTLPPGYRLTWAASTMSS